VSEPVTAYAASRVLGRDRQTIQRVVDRLTPDDFEKGRPRWHVERIAAALALSPCARRQTGRFRDRFSIRHRALTGLRVTFERQLAAIAAETSPAKRHEMAVAMAPTIGEFQQVFLEVARALRVAADDAIGAQSDLILEEMVGEVAEAAGQNVEGFFSQMVEAMASHADEVAP
jgi:hypothetical protein